MTDFDREFRRTSKFINGIFIAVIILCVLAIFGIYYSVSVISEHPGMVAHGLGQAVGSFQKQFDSGLKSGAKK